MLSGVHAEMRFCEINKEMSWLYFGLDMFCQFKARVPEFDTVFSVQHTLYGGGGGVACQILGLWAYVGRIELTQNTMTTSPW
jgi:hypothetical protein